MDAIKKKMQSLKSETENSLARAEQLDMEAKEANSLAERTEEHVRSTIAITFILSQFRSARKVCSRLALQVRDLQKKMQHVENELDNTIEKLSSTNTKLDEKDKAFQVMIQMQFLLGSNCSSRRRN